MKLDFNVDQYIEKIKNQKTIENESYNQYLLIEIVNRALTNVLENPDSQNLKTK